MSYQKELAVAKRAVILASRLCEDVRQALLTSKDTLTMTKTDRTPVTIADYGSQAIICKMLRNDFPNDPVVAEEDASDLRLPAQKDQLRQITEYVNKAVARSSVGSSSGVQPNDLLDWIDFGDGDVDPTLRRFWTLDPIDGTKGFLRGDQYAICLALIEEGEVKIGILGCPALELDGSVGHLFSAERGKGCSQESLLDSDDNEQSKTVRVSHDSKSMMQSFEASHSNHSTQEHVAKQIGLENIIRMDSQAKYAMVASGHASLYLRLSDYKQNIWDHAAGTIVVQEAGGKVSDRNGKPLNFCVAKRMNENDSVLVSNGRIHEEVLTALQE
uniref:3'(2'),5'-bisphosphate nucleotidase n=1 Tax=Helicotheca tamesis TaxID=374047 RepID=A0A7S2H9D6_9STRA|mmetsp:Transcript_16326/g.22394  ORF Transcript_16326/g.22394 Transcript_16326/m.22394 type:complete len:329 (+) Transcript_16326:91-1077(+)|eukprot:CAMPEP_0185733702 /NCGR_PEP_ID=MMETSP1171-20130828/20334_1 /TAXON_ID=374046 /ORGANISM="Helicotheca tamensis, Strain CCMP826" /LENGTH=328 /DNA_ID=CAMNT_0028403491 /DNA_START=22 /DNA_END=1008 /DNA_ORIENTATION=+